ncbi:MAG: hypothetical protein JNK56_33355, partial [Myxococcales bacterium]|nr:hypothetical protein [Myxococcales bacterium]
MRTTRTPRPLALLATLLLAGCPTNEAPPADTTGGSSSGGTTQAAGPTATGELPTTGDGTSETAAPTTGSSTGTTGAVEPDPDVCPGGEVQWSVVLASQADVDRMHGCTSVGGRLDIMGDDIVDLGPLAALVKVGNYLDIRANPALTSLAGLEQLESVGTLYIDSNPALTDLEGLRGLRSVGGIGVSQNPALTSLKGLRNVALLLSPSPLVFVSANAQLGSLAGIEGIVASDEVQLALVANPALADLSALAGVDRLESLDLSGNTGLTTLAGLEQLSHVGAGLSLRGNDALLDLDGLSGLREVGYLALATNAALTDLAGLS